MYCICLSIHLPTSECFLNGGDVEATDGGAGDAVVGGVEGCVHNLVLATK